MGVPDSFGSKIGGDPVPLSLRDCTDRTRCGIGLGHGGRGWKTGALGLREAEGLSCGLLSPPWWSLFYKIRSIPCNKRAAETHTTGLIGIVSALSTSIAESVAITADPITDGGSTGVKTPELLKEEFSGCKTPQESYPTWVWIPSP